MTMFQMGNPQPGTASSDIYAYTFVRRIAGSKYSPSVAGGAADGVANDTVEAGTGFGVMMPNHGGTRLPVLLGAAVDELEEVGVGVVSIGGVNVPCAVPVGDLVAGNLVVGRHVGATTAAADTDLTKPSGAIEMYEIPRRVV